MFDDIFQNIINRYIVKKNKKIYYFYFSIFKFLTKSKFIIPFKNYKFYASFEKKDLSRWMLKNLQEWDNDNVKKIIKLIKKHKASFVDCGCNFGAYSIPVAKKYKKSSVYALDASEKALKLFSANLNLNKIKNIKYFNYGIGEKNTTKYFNENISELKNTGSYRYNSKKRGKIINIYKFDDILKKNKIKLKKNIIIKLDLEGYDFLALKGMKKTIRKSKVIIFIEISKMLFKNTKNFSHVFNSFLKKNNLKFYDLNFNIKNFKEINKHLNLLNMGNETIGDFIISNQKL